MKLILLPDLSFSSGGPASFQRSFKHFLESQSIPYSHDYLHGRSSCLVINGSKRIDILFKCWILRRPIVVRLGSRFRSNIIYSNSFFSKIRYFPRYLSINLSLLLCSSVIFQSRVVEREWSNHRLLRRKKSLVIYNPVAPSVPLDSSKFKPCRPIHLVAFEGCHPPAQYSLPLILAKYLNQQGIVCQLHIIGTIPESWNDSNLPDSVTLHGHMSLSEVRNLLLSLPFPIYIPSDNFPCGCPNAFLEIQSLGVPSIALSQTPQAELILRYKGGCIAETNYLQLRSGVFSPLNTLASAVQEILHNYASYSYNASIIPCDLSPKTQFSKYIHVLSE